jgi:hypothetical protein|tara:strand:+ start:410 stop:547 length:138 start_codon:yes stop_codon:yes gene_type:complete
MAAFLPNRVDPKPRATPSKSQTGKNIVVFIFFFISFSKKIKCSFS